MFGLGGVLSMRRSTSSCFLPAGVFMAMIQIWSLPPDEYLTLIGRFIVSMSYVEIYLKQLLWKSAHLGHEMGALFSAGARLDDIQKLLRTIYNKHCPNQLQVDDIESISAETTSLKVAQDTMAHQQWNVEGRERTVILRRALARTAEQPARPCQPLRVTGPEPMPCRLRHGLIGHFHEQVWQERRDSALKRTTPRQSSRE